ncbi:hypothetical protein ACHAWF_004482 [Thalassiosira exigua]
MSLLPQLELHPCLRSRIHRVHPPPPSRGATDGGDATAKSASDDFVLYLPTVCLRHEQNPSFAVACRAANRLRAPLVVLAVVLDDASHAACLAHPHRRPPAPADAGSDRDSRPATSVAMTSRRLAFALQALSHACALWSAHGAAVGVRLHGAPGARTPDHLTLASRAALVVTDEPFVSPFSTMVRKVEGACKRAGVECLRVDGSATVPPVQVLTRRTSAAGGEGKVKFDGVPAKAYQWQKKTEHLRQRHMEAAMGGHFDAPPLLVTMDDEDLFAPVEMPKDDCPHPPASKREEVGAGQRLAHLFSSRWKPKPSGDDAGSFALPNAPGVRPFTSRELSLLYENDDQCFQGSSQKCELEVPGCAGSPKPESKFPLHNFALNWPGADPTVPPCPQTIGTTAHGMQRWNNFVQKGLGRYGKERNDARLVHSVSRMSAYLNLGVVSIFRIVWEVKRAQKQQQTRGKGSGTSPKATRNKWDNRNKSGSDKFEEEVVKWREMSYAHAFSREDYDDVSCLPRWSVASLNDYPRSKQFTLEQLARSASGDAKWDAMQQYLVRTGELHNNVRMTWGKTVVEWMGCSFTESCLNQSELILRTLCFLNDRYALDGLSPPSYAGLLWCMGWTDKPSAASGWIIAKKPAHRYRMNPDDFRGAERKLLASPGRSKDGPTGVNNDGDTKHQQSLIDMMTAGSGQVTADNLDSKSKLCSRGMKRNASFTIDSFFSPNAKKGGKGKSKQIVG